MPGPPTRGSPASLVLMRFCLLFSYRFCLTLTLLVAWVVADHHDVSVTTNDLALVANWLDAWVDLHDFSFSLASYPSSRAVPSVRLLVAVDDSTTGEVVRA